MSAYSCHYKGRQCTAIAETEEEARDLSWVFFGLGRRPGEVRPEEIFIVLEEDEEEEDEE